MVKKRGEVTTLRKRVEPILLLKKKILLPTTQIAANSTVKTHPQFTYKVKRQTLGGPVISSNTFINRKTEWRVRMCSQRLDFQVENLRNKSIT